MAAGYEAAASVRTMVRYDGRGTGLSQRDVDDFSLEAFLADLDAVVMDLGAPKVALEGIVNTCPVAIAYAVHHPERVSELILWLRAVGVGIAGLLLAIGVFSAFATALNSRHVPAAEAKGAFVLTAREIKWSVQTINATPGRPLRILVKNDDRRYTRLPSTTSVSTSASLPGARS